MRLVTSALPSVRLSVVLENLAITGHISVKFYISGFYQNLSTKFKFGKDLTKITDPWLEYLVYSFNLISRHLQGRPAGCSVIYETSKEMRQTEGPQKQSTIET
jgi:hypothetical protein